MRGSSTCQQLVGKRKRAAPFPRQKASCALCESVFANRPPAARERASRPTSRSRQIVCESRPARVAPSAHTATVAQAIERALGTCEVFIAPRESTAATVGTLHLPSVLRPKWRSARQAWRRCHAYSAVNHSHGIEP